MLSLSIYATIVNAQQAFNTTFLAQWDNNTLPMKSELQYNDCWGFEKDSREYAVIGSLTKVHFIEVTNPSTIYEVQNFTPGANSLWRDFKFYKNYIYATADEGSEGLLVFNVNNINATSNRVTQAFQDNTTFQRCHNIWIDTIAGRLYCAGTNTRYDGVIVYDIKTNPASPTVCANIPLRTGTTSSSGYIHDIHVYNKRMYCSHIYVGRMDVYDATAIDAWTPSSSVITSTTRLGSSIIPGAGYNHSSYLSQDKTKLIMAEETHGRPLSIVDITDPSDITVTSSIYACSECPTGQNTAPNGTGSIVHNPFVKGNLLFLAYYHEGLVIYDIANPTLPQKVAYYDTDYPNRSTYYNSYYGAWGTYPYLPSQRVLVSDIQNGLFVLQLASSLLPVDWVSFMAKKTNNNATQLRWTVASQHDVMSYCVERSDDGLNFKPITTLKAQQNTTQALLQYDFLDENPLSGNNYYRIKATDKDGAITYSKIESVNFDGKIAAPLLFPNPLSTQNALTLQFVDSDERKKVSVAFFNIKGQLLSEQTMDWTKSITLQPQLPQGMYIVKTTIDNAVFHQKIWVD